MMTDRAKALLLAIIEEHIKTSHPIGSKVIVERYFKDLSSATIRNEMARLERLGFIEQPHTSAGRIPTAKAYEYYVDNALEQKKLNQNTQKRLQRIMALHQKDYGLLVREVAKQVAELSSEAVIIGFSPRDVYYTGLSNLFQQPEFSTLDLVYNFSQMIDHLDEVMEELYPRVNHEVKILVGEKNPFGAHCGVLVTKYGSGSNRMGMFGILGPVRMPYEDNRALLEYTRSLLSK